jgi:hypothetical protein
MTESKIVGDTRLSLSDFDHRAAAYDTIWAVDETIEQRIIYIIEQVFDAFDIDLKHPPSNLRQPAYGGLNYLNTATNFNDLMTHIQWAVLSKDDTKNIPFVNINFNFTQGCKISFYNEIYSPFVANIPVINQITGVMDWRDHDFATNKFPAHWLFNDFEIELRLGIEAYRTRKEGEYQAKMAQKNAATKKALEKLTAEEIKILGISDTVVGT